MTDDLVDLVSYPADPAKKSGPGSQSQGDAVFHDSDGVGRHELRDLADGRQPQATAFIHQPSRQIGGKRRCRRSHDLDAPATQGMEFWSGLGHAAQNLTALVGGIRAVGQQHGHGAGTPGQRGQGVLEDLHAPSFEHALDHDVVDFAGGFTGDDHAGPDLTELDPVGDVENTVEHAQAGVAEVVDGGIRADAQVGSDAAGGGRLELLAADAGVNERVDVAGRHARVAQRLVGGRYRPLRNGKARIPPAPFHDARERFQLAFRDAQRLVHRPQPLFQLLGRHHHRRQLISQRIDKHARIIHHVPDRNPIENPVI